MKTSTRRRGALTAVLGLVLGTSTIVLASSAVSAGTAANTNSCENNVTGAFSDLEVTLSGDATPNPQILGAGTVDLTGGQFSIDVPADVLIAGYNLGLLVEGLNLIPGTVDLTISASNTSEGTQVLTGIEIVGETTITDPGTGPADVTATPLSVTTNFANTTWTPTGGNIQFRDAGSNTAALVAGGLISVAFDCVPGTTILDPVSGDGIGRTEAEAAPFETGVVNAPPTAPVCENESASVGVTQTITIDLNDNCTDVNEDQGGGSPFIFLIDQTGLAGTLTPTAIDGVYTYEAPATDPGAPTTFTFTATDTTGLVSNVATVSITILANQCDATAEECTLTQIVVQPVEGTVLTFDKAPGPILMSTVDLDGDAQVSTGTLNQATVTNARGTAAGWSLTAYSTDIGAAGGPTFDLTPVGLTGVIIPTCTVEGTPTGGLLGENTEADRLCIPGNNLAWTPAAAIAHDVIYGDVAEVNPGAAIASDAADWRAQLVAAGNANAGGLGGLGATNSLCSAPTNQSGGTFSCDAAMYLGVPASAGEGTYTGGLVMTLT